MKENRNNVPHEKISASFSLSSQIVNYSFILNYLIFSTFYLFTTLARTQSQLSIDNREYQVGYKADFRREDRNEVERC